MGEPRESPSGRTEQLGGATTVSLLFTDIEGSTRQWEDSPVMSSRVEQHFALLRSAVDAAGGELFATMGDGIAAAFPTAHGAVEAALSGQRRMSETGLAVRMGINTGAVERVGDDYRGRAVNRAARIMAAGHGGQVLVSDVTAALLRNESEGAAPIELVDLGYHRLRDLREPERIWQACVPDRPQWFPPIRAVDVHPAGLPAPRSSLVGRARDLERIGEAVRRHRLVTLTGTGGVGKTRLAVHVAAGLPPGTAVHFVDLAAVADPDDVVDAFAVTLGATTVADTLAAVASLIGARPTLLVVDNCEHLLDRVATIVDHLTATTRQLTVLATSREPLGLDGEEVLPVRPLEAAAAQALFRERARSAGADLPPATDADVVALCRRLEGIPLAIELAAARTASLGVAAVDRALDDSIAVLERHRRRDTDRHGAMRATIEWSYHLLDQEERRLFQQLAVFGSGLELDALVHVAAADGLDAAAATSHLDSLVRKSLLIARATATGLRYRMLETVRAVAREQLEAAGRLADAAKAHAEWVVTLTDLPYADCCSPEVERNAVRLEREADNWRAAAVFAAATGDGDLAARLCGPPVAFFLLGRHDLADVVRPLLALCDGRPLRRRNVLCALLVSASGTTDPDDLQSWAEEIQRVEAVEPTGLGGLMQWMALAWRGDFVTSTRLCVAASLDKQLAQTTRDLFVGIAVLDHFSLTDAVDDEYDLIPRALEVADRSPVGITRVSSLLGAAWGMASTDPRRALGLVRRALVDIPRLPALTRLTMPGSAARLLTHLDPAVAARGLLEQLDAAPAHRTFVDLIPLFYSAELLHGLGHDAFTTTVVPPMTVSPVAPYLSMMDAVDLARQAFSTANPVALDDFESTVREALAELAAA